MEDRKKRHRCAKCAGHFDYVERDTWWDYKGMDYDAKLVECPECGCINVIKYVEMPDREIWLWE